MLVLTHVFWISLALKHRRALEKSNYLPTPMHASMSVLGSLTSNLKYDIMLLIGRREYWV